MKTVFDRFTQICLGVKHIHDRKIIHRDLKPENILVMKNNKLKICDFGLAKALSWTFQKTMTCAGSPYYIAPEIWNR